jgi:hypothetical protein
MLIQWGHDFWWPAQPMTSSRQQGFDHLFAQMIVAELGVVAAPLSRPGAQPPAGLPHRKVGVQHNAVHAIASPFQQFSGVSREVIHGIHAKPYSHPTTFSPAIRQRRISFSQRSLGKGVASLRRTTNRFSTIIPASQIFVLVLVIENRKIENEDEDEDEEDLVPAPPG